jgi:hypothetical protein
MLLVALNIHKFANFMAIVSQASRTSLPTVAVILIEAVQAKCVELITYLADRPDLFKIRHWNSLIIEAAIDNDLELVSLLQSYIPELSREIRFIMYNNHQLCCKIIEIVRPEILLNSADYFKAMVRGNQLNLIKFWTTSLM